MSFGVIKSLSLNRMLVLSSITNLKCRTSCNDHTRVTTIFIVGILFQEVVSTMWLQRKIVFHSGGPGTAMTLCFLWEHVPLVSQTPFRHVLVGCRWWQKLYRIGDLIRDQTDESRLLPRRSILWPYAFDFPGADFLDLRHFEMENWCISFHALAIRKSSDLLQACSNNHVRFYSTNFYELTSFFYSISLHPNVFICFETTLNLLENETIKFKSEAILFNY